MANRVRQTTHRTRHAIGRNQEPIVDGALDGVDSRHFVKANPTNLMPTEKNDRGGLLFADQGLKAHRALGFLGFCRLFFGNLHFHHLPS